MTWTEDGDPVSVRSPTEKPVRDYHEVRVFKKPYYTITGCARECCPTTNYIIGIP
jgi:hypothetical protein